jgi:hypothetical protein
LATIARQVAVAAAILGVVRYLAGRADVDSDRTGVVGMSTWPR